MGVDQKEHRYDGYRYQVKPALSSKLDEFRLLGYDAIVEDDLWEYLTRKKWKKLKEERKLFELVQDILSIKVSDYLSYRTIETYKSTEFKMDDEEEWKELLK